MTTVTECKVALYVDRETKQLIVRDLEGNFWQVPLGDDGWDRRQSYELTEDRDLEAIPGHYKYMLTLPF